MTTLRIKKIKATKNFLWFIEYNSGLQMCLDKLDFKTVLEKFKYFTEDNMGTDFASQLFRLICKADDSNKIKIMHGFPEHVVIYLLWYLSANPNNFFDEWEKELSKEITEGFEDEE